MFSARHFYGRKTTVTETVEPSFEGTVDGSLEIDSVFTAKACGTNENHIYKTFASRQNIRFWREMMLSFAPTFPDYAGLLV